MHINRSISTLSFSFYCLVLWWLVGCSGDFRNIDEDENEKTDALAEKLRGPMNDQGQKLRQQMRDTIVPAIQQVREIHDTLENEGTNISLCALSHTPNAGP